jgi:hypothetical protein
MNMDIDFGKLDDDIGRLLVMINRARGETREAGFVGEWEKVLDLAVSIHDRVDMREPPKVDPEPEPVKPPRKPAHK